MEYLSCFVLYYKEIFLFVNYENERSGIMAAKSFTDTYVINRDDVNRFHNIMNNKKQARVTKVMNHKDVKSKHAKSLENLVN